MQNLTPEMCLISTLGGQGFVRLVSFMQPAINYPAQGWDGDLEVVRNARVSYNADRRVETSNPNDSSDAKLLHYMQKNHHTSPFEAMVFTFELQVPIYIARQWHRHRTWAYNEVSARYTELDMGFYCTPAEEIGTQSKSNKQVRDIDEAFTTSDIARDAYLQMARHMSAGERLYKTLLEFGIPREVARTILPVSTITRFFGTVNLHNLFGFIRLRMHPHAQKEIQVYAEALLQLAWYVSPISVEAFVTFNFDNAAVIIEKLRSTTQK